jgi:hypothetical protein
MITLPDGTELMLLFSTFVLLCHHLSSRVIGASLNTGVSSGKNFLSLLTSALLSH